MLFKLVQLSSDLYEAYQQFRLFKCSDGLIISVYLISLHSGHKQCCSKLPVSIWSAFEQILIQRMALLRVGLIYIADIYH